MPLGVNGATSGGNAGGAGEPKLSPNRQKRAFLKALQADQQIQAATQDHTEMKKINFMNAVEDGHLVGGTMDGENAYASLQDLNRALDITLSDENLETLESTIQTNRFNDVPCKLTGIDSPTTTKGWVELIQGSYSPS